LPCCSSDLTIHKTQTQYYSKPVTVKSVNSVSNLHCLQRDLKLVKQHILEVEVGEAREEELLWLAYQCGKQHSAV
jgi:hypothetical protein